jgi:hypothetical protein
MCSLASTAEDPGSQSLTSPYASPRFSCLVQVSVLWLRDAGGDLGYQFSSVFVFHVDDILTWFWFLVFVPFNGSLKSVPLTIIKLIAKFSINMLLYTWCDSSLHPVELLNKILHDYCWRATTERPLLVVLCPWFKVHDSWSNIFLLGNVQ